MRYLYSLLIYLLSPLIIIRLFVRSIQSPGYGRAFWQRFGFFNSPSQPVALWIHAVSFGEINAAAPIIQAWQQSHPDDLIVVTNMTATGAARTTQLFDNKNVLQLFIPYDFPGAVCRFLSRIQPRLAVMIETELWPNLLHHCQRRHIPVLLANARLSKRSAQRYQYITSFSKQILQAISCIAAQNENTSRRFLALGYPKEKLRIVGSVKFDIHISNTLIEKAKALRTQWGSDRPVWIAASTHDGEDQIALNVFKVIKKSLPDTLLILVPRHPERFRSVATLSEQSGYHVIRRSQEIPCNRETDIFIGDTMGELPLFYATADIAFVGGSLIQRGGHNPLEPAALGIPILTGPHIFNFTEIYDLLLKNDALKIINNNDELVFNLLSLLKDNKRRELMGKNGLTVVKKNRGAVEQHIKLMDQLILSKY